MPRPKKQQSGKTFEGRVYTAESKAAGPPHLAIEGVEVPVERAPTGGFESIWMPHRAYDTLDELAQDIIRFHPTFKKR